jgi:hypothetical protein
MLLAEYWCRQQNDRAAIGAENICIHKCSAYLQLLIRIVQKTCAAAQSVPQPCPGYEWNWRPLAHESYAQTTVKGHVWHTGIKPNFDMQRLLQKIGSWLRQQRDCCRSFPRRAHAMNRHTPEVALPLGLICRAQSGIKHGSNNKAKVTTYH